MDGQENRAAKHVRTSTPLNVDNVSVQLSPQMLRCLSRIEAAVHDSDHFDPDIKKNLQDYASGRPFSSIRMAFSGIAIITQETMEHVYATGDRHAKDALEDFINQFYKEEEQGVPSFTLVPKHTKTR